MRALLVLILLVSFQVAIKAMEDHKCDLPCQWSKWKSQYNKSYETLDEEHARYNNWLLSFKRVHQDKPKASFELGLNAFSDWTHEEFTSRLGLRPYLTKDPLPVNICEKIQYRPEDPRLSEIDWRSKGMVTSVKNQGQCGSCWAFSAVATIESAWAIQAGSLYNISEQELVDCSRPEGNFGCEGGLMDDAFNYTIVNHGLCLDMEYPYTAKDGKCQPCRPVVTIMGCHDIQTGNVTENEEAMLVAVSKGPISVGVYAGNALWYHYIGGILDDLDCLPGDIDHGVVIVGYGTEAGKDYWIIKNSWGADWGESGYIRIIRGKNMCRIGQMGTSVQVRRNDLPEPKWDLIDRL